MSFSFTLHLWECRDSAKCCSDAHQPAFLSPQLLPWLHKHGNAPFPRWSHSDPTVDSHQPSSLNPSQAFSRPATLHGVVSSLHHVAHPKSWQTTSVCALRPLPESGFIVFLHLPHVCPFLVFHALHEESRLFYEHHWPYWGKPKILLLLQHVSGSSHQWMWRARTRRGLVSGASGFRETLLIVSL